MGIDQNPDYWDSYTNLQRVKHALIKEYLGGWFPKLGFWCGRIAYLDTHAGRGKYATGDQGSPLVALRTLLSHSYRDRLLSNCEMCFLLIEQDPDNVEGLRREVQELGELPDGVKLEITCEDCFGKLENLVTDLETRGKRIAPAFVFVDPYGFKVPGKLLSRLLQAGRVEVFINVIWRELDMAIQQALRSDDTPFENTLGLVFGGDVWRTIGAISEVDCRADATVDALRDLYGAKWATSMRMLGSNGITRYMLAHFTHHESGRDLMKDCMWKVCPGGGFYARRSDNPRQILLIEPEPDLSLLNDWLTRKLAERPHRWGELSDALRNELWRGPQLSDIIRRRRREGSIIASDFEGRFSEKANPLLTLSDVED